MKKYILYLLLFSNVVYARPPAIPFEQKLVITGLLASGIVISSVLIAIVRNNNSAAFFPEDNSVSHLANVLKDGIYAGVSIGLLAGFITDMYRAYALPEFIRTGWVFHYTTLGAIAGAMMGATAFAMSYSFC